MAETLDLIDEFTAPNTPVTVQTVDGYAIFHRRYFNPETGQPLGFRQTGEIAISELPAMLTELDARRAALQTFIDWIATAEANSAPPTVQSAARVISVETFRKRFTDAEIQAIAASTDATVRLFVIKLTTRQTPIDLDDPQIVAGLAYLVSVQLLTGNRAEAIKA